MDQQLAARKAALAELKMKYTENHPDVLRLAKEVEELERKASLAAAQEQEPARAALTPLGAQEQTAAPETTTRSFLGAQIEATSEITEAELRLQDESLKNEIAKLEKEREDIKQQMKAVQARLNLTPALEQELLAMTREHSGLLGRYNDLRNKKYSTQMATILETDRSNEVYRIIDPAILPERPVFPNRPQMIVIGIAAGLLLGLGAAFAREYLDPTLASEEEAVAVLNLPVLVSIPELPGRGAKVKRLTGSRRAA